MANIHILDDITVDKIAAGEVVERPASVIKELVENSIDAKAKKIEVEIMAGGTSFMRVSDDGEGMDNKNARLAILRHATSKIQKVDDLHSIDSLGFRGEALPSIAAVSRFHLLTRQQGKDLGTSVKLSGGKVVELDDAGCSLGTTIKVEDLFFNVPARKKFLKTANTEANKINDFIIKLAFSKPDIAFKFINNNRLSITTPGNNSLYDAIEAVYGAKVSEELLPIEFEDEGISITGFITKPAVIRSSRSWQTLLINGRIISSRVIYKAIDNAYHSLLPKSGYPFVLLDIKIDKRSIDINVHPQKADVKFEDEGRLFKAVYAAVLGAVKPHEEERDLTEFAAPINKSLLEKPREIVPTFQNLSGLNTSGKGNANIGFSSDFSPSNYSSNADYESKNNTFVGYNPSCSNVNQKVGYTYQDIQNFREVRDDIARQRQVEVEENSPKYQPSANISMPNDSMGAVHNYDNSYPTNSTSVKPSCDVDETAPSAFRFAAELIPLGQIDKCFIVAQGPEGGMYLIDQHAAHERILYDRFSKQKDDIAVQPLLMHMFLDVSGQEVEMVEEHQEILNKLGFEVELAGEYQVRLIAIPADIKTADAEEVFREVIKALLNLHEPTPQEIRHSCIAMTACKAAIKAGDILSLQQIKVLLLELANTTLPYTCPHGRPTIIKFSTYDLEKMFKRIV